jgi:hypothetical protein
MVYVKKEWNQMQVQRVQYNFKSPSFNAGKVNLVHLDKKELLVYDTIKKIAEDNKLDLSIKKGKESKFFPKDDFYFVFAAKQMDKYPFVAYGMGCTIVNKQAQAEDLSVKLYDAVINSIEKLVDNILKYTGIRPEVIKNIP